MKQFSPYKPRRIAINRLALVNGWQVKVYTITHRHTFEADRVLKSALDRLPDWLEAAHRLELPTYRAAFLIVHEGRDGVWSLLNWWIGGEMLQGMTYFTGPDQSDVFEQTSGQGFMACVWELPTAALQPTNQFSASL